MFKHDSDPLSHYRTAALIATYEDLFQVPRAERITEYFSNYGIYVFKYGTADDAVLSSYDKALAAIQMDSESFCKQRISSFGDTSSPGCGTACWERTPGFGTFLKAVWNSVRPL